MKPIKAKDLLELDKNLQVVVLQCYPEPEKVIYQAGKADYSETPIHSQQIPSSHECTGKRVIKVASGELKPEDVFFVRPPGFYTNRYGKKYDWTQEDYQDELDWILEGCKRYAAKYEKGMCEEHIRDYLAQAIRQNFVVSFNLRSVLHIMDLRAKMDAQLEIQALCEQFVPHLQEWAPNVWQYYEEKRLHRARLSP